MAKSSCIFSAPNGVNFLADIQQDDNAQLQRHYQSSFHANPSFEQEDLYWGTGGGGVLTTPVMSNAKRGSRVGRLEGSYGAYAYQTITLRTKEATVAGGNPGKVDMRLFHKSGSSPATGHVSVAIHSKLFDVGAASDPCNPGVTAWNYESGGTWSEANGWAYAVTAPDWDAGAEWGDGVVIRIYVYNYRELDGSPWPVQLDDVRARPQ